MLGCKGLNKKYCLEKEHEIWIDNEVPCKWLFTVLSFFAFYTSRCILQCTFSFEITPPMYCPIKLKICVVVNVIRITCRSYFPTTMYMTNSKPLYFYYVKVNCPWYLQYLTCHFSSLYQSLFRQGTFKQGDILSSTSSPFVGQCMDIIGTNYFLVVPWHERFNSHHVNTLYLLLESTNGYLMTYQHSFGQNFRC